MRRALVRTPVRRLANRVYGDFLMPSRLGDYARLLEQALQAGYEVHSVGSFWRTSGPGIPQAGTPSAGESWDGRSRRVLVLRHDIDTDPATARSLWRIDRRLGVRGSWFFRLGTFDPDLAVAIADGGGEVGYHYEELATLARERRLRTRDDALAAVPAARVAFAGNLRRLRARTGLPLTVAASHGDFANRRVGVPNWEILTDPSFRASVGIELETYDPPLLARLPRRFSDTLYPRFWEPSDPTTAIRAGEPVVSLLVHPRHWRPDPAGNLRDDVRRLADEVHYRLPG